VSGRLKHYINAFGEEVIIENADRAIAAACQQTGARVNDYTAAPIYFDTHNNGAHEWLIEFETVPDNMEQFTFLLDDALRKLNSDYDAKRYRDIALSLPRVHAQPKGVFTEWLRRAGKLGGQHKVPRLSNDRSLVEALLKLWGDVEVTSA
jgi:hypothetical protein